MTTFATLEEYVAAQTRMCEWLRMADAANDASTAQACRRMASSLAERLEVTRSELAKATKEKGPE